MAYAEIGVAARTSLSRERASGHSRRRHIGTITATAMTTNGRKREREREREKEGARKMTGPMTTESTPLSRKREGEEDRDGAGKREKDFRSGPSRENSSLSRGHRDARYFPTSGDSASLRVALSPPAQVLFLAVALSCSGGGGGASDRASQMRVHRSLRSRTVSWRISRG